MNHLPLPLPPAARPPGAPTPNGASRAAGTDPAQDERLARLAARRSGTNTARPGTTNAGASPGSARHDRATPSGRNHPASRARATALALGLTTTIGLATYLHETSAASAGDQATTISGSLVPDSPTDTAPSVEPVESVESVEPVEPVTTGLADGTFTGDTVSMKWGPVQVAITVAGGRISSIDALQYPTDDRKSVQINQQAVPTLIAETLEAQTSDVDTVSGATYTSDGYRASLQTAIDDARAAATAG